jgi:hypothetical protein
MPNSKDVIVGENWVKVCSHLEVMPNLVIVLLILIPFTASNAYLYVESLFPLMILA